MADVVVSAPVPQAVAVVSKAAASTAHAARDIPRVRTTITLPESMVGGILRHPGRERVGSSAHKLLASRAY
ncbi:hypothetical protein NCAST_35_00780 [Nocardia asteroides NBRC 15531]|uniref:Uncharacterized protein n=1 Tax=Nocardia asteroides NBRC 15531 TaxID=1110697 RepID=U5EMD7_NOCAS|nr:hypothetical protein NCAST_35_00780 [Nocardia asteroides NBRC 15531]